MSGLVGTDVGEEVENKNVMENAENEGDEKGPQSWLTFLANDRAGLARQAFLQGGHDDFALIVSSKDEDGSILGVLTPEDLERPISDNEQLQSVLLYKDTNFESMVPQSVATGLGEEEIHAAVLNMDGDGKGKKVVVIGGAGYLGCPVVENLLDAGFSVCVLDRCIYGDEGLSSFESHPRYSFVKGDMRNFDLLMKTLRSSYACILLASLVGDPACAAVPRETLDVNYLSSKLVCVGCQCAGVQRFVFASSCSVYGASSGMETLDEFSPVNPVSLSTQYPRLHLNTSS